MTTPILHLVDLSSNNGPVDMAKIKQAGIDGVVLKLTEGIWYKNDLFDQAWKDAKTANLWRAAYHFCRPDDGGYAETEAEWFLQNLPALDVYDGVAGDIEVGTGDQVPFALAWFGMVAKQVGFPPLLYSYEAYIKQSLQDTRLTAYPLWLSAQPTLPLAEYPWKSIALWQYSWAAHVSGVNGPVDESELARDLAGLRALGKPPIPARIMVACSLKPDPSHTSPALIALLPDTPVLITGDPVRTDDLWVPIRAQGVNGYVPQSKLKD